MPTTNMNFIAANQQNPMAMLYQRPMAQNPLVMMNMNPMMGMGMMGMNGFNAMNMGSGIPTMNMMSTGLNGITNGITNGMGNGMGNVNPMRFGPIGNHGLGNQSFMGGGSGQSSGVQVRNPGMGMRQVASGGGLNQGRIPGNPGPGPTRMATRGQHGFHPYAR